MRFAELHENIFDGDVAGAAEIQAGHEPDLRDDLLEAGADPRSLDDLVEVVARHAEREAFHVSAKALRQIFRLIATRSTFGAALAHVVALHSEASLQELAAVFGTSKQSLHNYVRGLRAALADVLPEAEERQSAERHRPPQPDDREGWLTTAEAGVRAARHRGVITEAARRAQLPSTLVANRFWFRVEDVDAWTRALEIERATKKQQRQEMRRPQAATPGADGVPGA